MSSACFIVQHFYKRSAQKGQSKQHSVCIKEKQNNSSQSFLRNSSTLKLPLAHVCLYLPYQRLIKRWIFQALDLAAKGDHQKVDKLVRDIYGTSSCNVYGLSGETVASSFGQVSPLTQSFSLFPLCK